MRVNLLLTMLIIPLQLLSCTGRAAAPSQEVDLEQQLLTLGVEPYLSPTPPAAEEIIPAATAPPLSSACPDPYLLNDSSRTAYDLSVYLGIEQHAAHITEAIRYPNQTGEELGELLLVVEPNWFNGVFSISELHVAGENLKDYRLEGGKLWLPLDDVLPNGCLVSIDLTYHLDLPDQPGVFGYTADQLVFTNWYPFVPPYDPGAGWIAHPPGAYGEHLAYQSADFDVSLEIADPPKNVLVAGPSPVIENDGMYNYQLRGARTFSFSVLTNYSLIQEKYQGIEISIFSQKATMREVEAALKTAVMSLRVFEGLFGPYSFESLTIAQLEMYDGMEYDGIFFLSEEVFKTYNWNNRNMLVYLVAHETAHNWWFSQVGNDQAMEPWLDEALSIYSELLFYEVAYPDLVDWWWEFRIDEYAPTGVVNASIYEYPIYEDYRRSVYLRGVEFIQALRDQVGDELFFKFLRSYLEQGRYKLVNHEDFFRLLEDEFEVDASQLRKKYFGN